MGTTTKAAEKKVIIDLTELLKKNADKVLSGETNLCLTTSSLSIMAIHFRRHSENTIDVAESLDKKAKSKEEIDLRIWQENIKTLLDFVLKVKALKIIHGSYTMKAPIQISRFRSLQVLEVKRVPIHMVEGLSKLRGQLKEITVSKSLQTLKDLLEICGGDRTPGLVWPHLKTVYLSFNSLQELDQSLNFIPFVEVIDLSHNSITKTADCLQSLLDLMRINLGYNMLKSVPQFSSVNKLKLRTLVLRNNSLENLDGVEELCALEELDVSENFLLDHRVLQGLLSLKRLQVLCLLGNPLCYKNDHRMLTLQHIYPHAGLGVFLLDGKRLTQQEITVLQENQYRLIYDQEAANSSSVNGTQIVDEGDSSIAVSQLSPHGSKKKRGHRRVHSKERIPKIKDFEESLKEDNTLTSQGVSPSTSCADESELEAQRQKDEKYYETFREHYKDDWLKALSASQKNDEHSYQSASQKYEEYSHQSASQKYEEYSHQSASQKNEESSQKSSSSKGQTVLEQLSVTRKDVKKESTEEKAESNVTGVRPEQMDKIKTKEKEEKPVVEEVIRAEVHSPVTSPVSPQGFESIRSPTSPEGVEIGENTDIYSLPKSDKEKREKHLFHMYSDDRVESPVSPQEENKELYGAESEPHIMMLPDDEMKPLIVTTNKRFIIEKDLSGKKIAALDLKCLKGVGKTVEKCYGRDLIGGFSFTILRLDFDYVRKDMRLRRYAVESDDEAKRFESLISHYVKSKEVVVEILQCLKCNHKFDKAPQYQSEDLPKCPKCSSKQVIKSFEESVTLRSSADESVTLRADSGTGEKSGDELTESKRRSWHRSTVRRSKRGRRGIRGDSPSDHEARENTAVDEVDSGIQNIIRPDTADRYSLGSSLKDYVDQMIPGPDTAKEENTQDSKDQSVGQTVTEPSTMKNNSSWSDVRKFGSVKSTPRDSVSSESDITVLVTNSSRGSIAAVSESIHEVLTTSATNIEHRSWSGVDIVGDTSGKDSSSDLGTIWTKDKQGQLTPVGSPLTNSVCSSMVSSVYENTLPGSGDDNAYTEMEDSVQLNNTSPHHDDIVKESVVVRRSKSDKTKNRQSSNRNFTVYDQEFNLDEPDSHVSIVIEDASKKSSSRESSIYDTPCSSNITKFENTQDRSVPSVYDTATSDDNLESSHDDTADLHSHSSRRSHDQSSANQSSSDHSSPLRRKGSSRSRSSSRSSSRNRSAVYIDSSMCEPEDKNNSANIPEFPSDLSPIKRTSSSRHSVQKRSALFIGNSSEISDLESQSLDLSTSAQISNPSDEVSELSQETPAQLPWEQSDNQSAEGSRKDESLNHDEFVNIDHNIKLYLELQVLRADETAQCAVQCDIVQYMKEEAMKSLLVISTNRFMVFRIEGEGPASPDWLKSYEDQPITELRYIDIGLGYQTIRLEFETECSSYTLIIGDEGRCKKFLTLISDIVANSDHSHLERIVKSNPTSLANLEQQVLTTEDDTQPQELVRYLMVKYSPAETTAVDIKMQSLVVTKTDLVLIDENHQWPLPRLQAPLSGDIKGRQFTVIQREKINNIGTLSFNEHKPTELQLSFLETSSADSPSTWFITFETMKGVKSFVDAIREPWEEEFGVSLDITAVSFTDSSLME